MTRRLFLGVDVSTTGSKALLVGEDGAVVANVTTPHDPPASPHPLWSEQDPADWWRATVASIRAALSQADTVGASGGRPLPALGARAEVVAIGLTGQMHGLVLLDERGAALRPAILWNDQRTQAECDEMRARLGGRERLIQITGNDALPGFTAPKILWVRRHEPEVYARACHVLLPKDYVRLRLTGGYTLDKADGSGTALFDLARRDWSDDVLAALEVPRAWLPETFEGPEVTGRVTAEAAALTGLAEGTPVVAGGGDQAAQAVGVGAVEPGTVALTLGTSGVVFAPANRPLVEPQGRLHAFCHALPGRWHLMGVMLAAAGSLQWYRDTLAPDMPFDALLAEAAEAPAGSDGLIFLPYLSGERTPHPDPLARGAFVGLTTRHRRAHLTRAVLEGVAFGLRDGFELLRSTGISGLGPVLVSGGGARSALWLEILAAVLGVELVREAPTEGAAYGAALLAGIGAGAWDASTLPSLRRDEGGGTENAEGAEARRGRGEGDGEREGREASAKDAKGEAGEEPQRAQGRLVGASGGRPAAERFAPQEALADTYERLYPTYRALYLALRPTFDALGTARE
ncbi:MAG TPA: xylulokinase [Ktedonobacterales bacterium]